VALTNQSSMAADAMPSFDCFSRPSLAVGILQHEAESRLSDYMRMRDQDTTTKYQHVPNGPSGSYTVKISADPFSRTAAVKGIEQLSTSIADLQNDLNRKLLLVYFESNLSNKFLDCYLMHLQESSPADIVVWGRHALECARQCSRTKEALEAMRHAMWYRPDAESAIGLQALLQDSAGPETPQQRLTRQ